MDVLLNNNNYDPNEELPSPSIEAVNRMLNLPSPFLFNKAPTPAGMNPSNHSSLSSPPQSTTLSDIFPFDDLDYNSDGSNHQLNTRSYDDLGTTLPTNDHFEIVLNNSYSGYALSDASSLELEDERLKILAEPRAFFRGRYESEVDTKKNRAQRYIRTEEGTPKYDHPTIKIPSKWLDLTRQLYIRVTSVTVKTKHTPYHCIHPYKIDTQESNVLKDKKNNSIYFPINPNEIITGEKGFLVSSRKMIQSDLKACGPFRVFDSNELDDQSSQNHLDAKQKIALYQLWTSQLVFTIAELQNNSVLVPYSHTSVGTRIMTDETGVPSHSPTNSLNDTSINQIKCIPQRGVWEGGEEIVLIMPNSIKKKDYRIFFDFGEHGAQSISDIRNIDTKTILFRTPRCPLLPGNEDVRALIIIQESQSPISTMEFCYITPVTTIIKLCPRCQENGINNSMRNKRKCEYDTVVDSILPDIEKLSIGQKPNQSQSQKSSEGSKFDKYLNQLKDALEVFVRKNDPSRLFRRTRILLSNYGEGPSPLHEAIENGHTDIALSLIEQLLDMPSPNRLLENENEALLLIAAKFNQWKIMELILKNRSDLIHQTDKDGNNLLHLLTNINDDKGVETIDKLLKTFPSDIKMLLNEENNQHQTPMNISQSNGNTQSYDLLTNFLNSEKNEI